MKPYWLTLLLISFVSVGVHADDTEIYFGNPNAETVKPNIVFIFDTSGSMETGLDGYRPPKSGEKRLDVTKRAAIETINGLSNVNLALMQFNVHSIQHGGFFELPMKSIDDPEHKQAIVKKINSFGHKTWTPIVESVHEAYRYFTGETVKYGRKGTKSNSSLASHEDTYKGSGSYATYISPITESCQKNHVVLFTDGGSTYDGGSDSDIRSLMKSNFSTNDLKGTGLGYKCNSNDTDKENNTSYAYTSCLRDLAYIMNNADASSELSDKQTVQFHAIGGFIGGSLQDTLDDAAQFGGGISANAQNYEDLKAALQTLFDNIVQSGGTFAAPAVSVNAFNSLEQLDQMYYSVFKPHEAVGWSGNVKRFRMAGDKIVDVKGNNAIDPNTGFFSETAQSYWTPDNLAPDGDKVVQGGMASRLQDNRKVMSNLVSGNLTHNDNRVRVGNNKLTREVLGTALTDSSFGGTDVDPSIDPDDDTGYTDPFDANEFTKLIQWLGGSTKTDANKSRRSMEDPLHSTPVLLNYGELTIDGKKVPDSTLFIGTNSGYLHAFDTHENSPKERFAFIPKELLPVATKYYENKGRKKYGLDGHISIWHDDTNKDMIINNGEKAYLYVGMRRGGSSYYALDVSNRDQPKLMWQINGKNHQNGPTSGFEELGQSWSKMIPADVKWNGTKKKVLLFAGGYDITEDTNFTRKNHSVGNAVYMVDAENGKLLWKASKTGANLNIADMKSAITGNIVPVDDNSDGFVDLLYIADLGGRIFRIDFNNSKNTANSYATGGMIADLGGTGQKDNVRFYDTLDVVYSKSFGYVEGSGTDARVLNDKPRYMLSIGSGYRAHPLEKSASDNFYVVFDYNTAGPAKDASNKPVYTAVKKSDLQDYQFSVLDKLTIKPTIKSNNGLYIKLKGADIGEKVLSSSLTLNNVIYFTTFRPSTDTFASGCTSDTGQSRLYQVNLNTAVDGLAEATVDELNIPGIPPKPVLIIPNDDPDSGDDTHKDPKLLISTQIIDTGESKFPLKKTYWRELEQ